MSLIGWTAMLNGLYLVRRLPCLLFGWHRRFRHLNASCRGREACARRLRRAWDRE